MHDDLTAGIGEVALAEGRQALAAGNPVAAAGFFRMARDAGATAGLDRLAQTAYHAGRLTEAELCFQVLAEQGRADASINLGAVLLRLGRPNEAEEHLRKALEDQPDDTIALSNLGNAYRAQGRDEEAAESFRRALAIPGAPAAAAANLGDVLHAQGRWREADDCYRRAEEIAPEMVAARWKRCFAPLATLYRDEGELRRGRESYLARLQAFADAPPGDFDLATAGLAHPFLLAYQGCNDRDAQAVWGGVMAKAARRSLPDHCRPLPARRRGRGEPVRVGFVCGYFRDHSVWKIPLGGWLENLDRSRFRLFGYHTRAECDSVTTAAERLCYGFVQGPLPTAEWARLIADDRLDVLIFPEIGMDPATLQLAALRLAPVQCVSQGHPTTTGLPTIDHWLSSAAMEPADGAAHYTEKLIRLPGLGYFHRPRQPAALRLERADIGVEDDAVLIWCCQYLSKYLPRHDDIFPRIARAMPHARFVFLGPVRGRAAAEIFRERLDAAFARHGLAADRHAIMLDRMPVERFDAVTRLADLALDTPDWNGNNSTLETLALGVPVLTTPGRLMRGRHASGILGLAGLADLIAPDVGRLVGLATELAADSKARAGLARRIREGLPACQRDRHTVGALERFLESASG